MRARDYRAGELVPGTVYKVVRLIGAGGMGSVYDVEDTTVGKRYVLKTLHARLGDRDDLARRIQKEARILGRLHHPNIVEVFTAGVTADALRLPYYVMERLSGQSLRVVLEKKGRLDLSHAYHIGIDLLDALDHAHDKGVVHRDVKPDNIFLHRPLAGLTVTKLLDFGIVSVLDGTNGETAGRFLGTLRYAAPEQLRGDKPTPKTDVYAAALVLYEIVAGRGPFDEEGDGHKIAAAHMNKFPLPISQFVKVPREFDALVMAALSKNPDARPRDAFSFGASLRNLQRALEDWAPRHSTDSRATVSAVIEPDPSASSLPVNVALHARLRDPVTPSPSTPPMRPVQTTLVGMPVPTLASVSTSALVVTPAGAPPTLPAATTHSAAFDTVRMPQHGTEVIDGGWGEPSAVALGEASTEIEWPAERFPAPSIEPQIQSLVVPPPSPRRRPSARSIRFAAGLASVVVVVTVLGLVVRRPSAPAFRSAEPAAPVPARAAMAAPNQDPEVTAAPGATPPDSSAALAPAETTAASGKPEVRPAPAPSSRPLATKARAAAPDAHPRPVAPPRYPTDRPGPGF